jgi:dTDP-4-amino-4,6-dideoxygalactose transaminase
LIRERELFVMSHEGPWHQEVHAFGLNYRLPDILAALGSSQLVRLAAFKAARAKIKARYDANFAGNEGILVPVQHPDVDPVWHLYPLRVPVSERRRIFEGLRRLGINVQVNYLPAYRHPALAEILDRRIECPNAEDFYAREISLPIWNGLDLETVDLISDRVLELLGGTGSRSRSF